MTFANEIYRRLIRSFRVLRYGTANRGACMVHYVDLVPKRSLIASNARQIELADQISEDDCAFVGHQ